MKVFLMNPLSASREMELCDLGLGYLASGLRQAGHEVRLLLRAMTAEQFERLLTRERPDVVGLKVFTSNVRDAIRTVQVIRKASRAVVVIGGPHVSGDPMDSLNSIPADFAFQGEADRAFPRFVSLLAAGAREPVPGLVCRRDGAMAANPPDLISDLDELPFPAWDLMPPGQYPSLVCRRRPAASVLTTRGCSHRCAFCAESYKRLRFRSVENILAEIKFLADRFGVREIQFLDSNFIARKDHVKDLGHRILQERLSLAFCAPNGTRLEAVDDEVCALLARVGLYRVNVGVESGSAEVLDRVQKRSDLDLAPEKVALFRKHGIQVVGNFMLGFPGETRAQMEETLRLALSLDLMAANFSIYVPMPGTKLYEELVRDGKLPAAPDFQNCDYVSYENRLSALSPAELRQFRNRCVRRFLLRGRTLKTLWELLRGGMLWHNLAQRLYFMYVEKFLKR